MVHGHGLLTWYSETTVSWQGRKTADWLIKCRPPSVRVAVVQSVLKSERRSFVLNSRNTDERYGGYPKYRLGHKQRVVYLWCHCSLS